MQYSIQKFRQSSIVFDSPNISAENLKDLTSSIHPKVQHVQLKLRTGFLLTNICKTVFGIFLFCLDLALFANIKKKIPSTLFVDIIQQETCAKFQRKEFGVGKRVVGARKNFQFFRKITWFLENNRNLSKFKYRVLHNFMHNVSIMKL